jgi:hypothetical protein
LSSPIKLFEPAIAYQARYQQPLAAVLVQTRYQGKTTAVTENSIFSTVIKGFIAEKADTTTQLHLSSRFMIRID